MPAKTVVGKKRNAPSHKSHNKPSKARKTVEKQIDQNSDLEEEKESEGLFDNLDEEMDQDELEKIVKQVETEDESGEEEIRNESAEDTDNESEDEDNIEEADSDDEVDEVQKEVSEDRMDDDTQEAEKSTASKFRNLYMTKVTQAFGSDLDQIRQEPNFNNVRLNVLIDSLEAGIDIFSNVEQEIILADEEKQ